MTPHLPILLLLVLLTVSAWSSNVVVRFDLPDNLANNMKLGNISSKSPAIPAPPPGSGGYFRVIMEPNNFVSKRFAVNNRTTGLTTTTAIDRDEICGRLNCCANLTCETNFTVFIRPTSRSYIRVIVTLVFKDSNDNPPVIPHENITLPETAKIGSLRALKTATDKDSNSNGVLYYGIKDPTATFDLHMASPTRPMLRLLKKLDADDPERREFRLIYYAVDGGKPALTGQTTLDVKVLDANDNPPIFRIYSRSVFVPENTSVGHQIYKFEATDGDVDPENKKITFHLDTAKSTPEGLADQKFSVKADTGAVVVRSALDYDKATERQFLLVVEARDHGNPSRSATATLTVVITNVNDNPPQISVTSSQPLQEGMKAGQQVRTISVSDLDQHESIKVKCTLQSSPGFKIVPITEQHYFDIVTTRVFDFETARTVNVTVVCKDQQSPGHTAVKTLTIPVVDINDHGPVFNPPSYTKQLSENTPLGSEVLTVKATDKDDGDFGTVRYSLDSVGRKWFKIDSLNGYIYVNTTLDRETSSVLNFYVKASDLGRPPKTSVAPVRITLADVNDNPPILVGPKAVDVVENAQPGTVITRVRFRDPDEGRNGQVDFKLVRDKNLSLRYLNMTSDGRVIVIRPMDREKVPRMYLDIQARDRGTPVMETTVSLIVRVLDLNDNAPRLVSPTNYSTLGHTIFANSPYNTTVGDLRAEDSDQRENGTVIYDILDTNATGMFRLESDTGRLYSAWKYPSQPGHGLYQLRIRLSDRGRPPLTSEAILFVNVGPPRSAKTAGISNIIILVLIIIASVAIATALVMAILWARSRAKRSTAGCGARSPDYAEYDPAVKKPRSMGDTETLSNMDMVSGLAVDPVGDSASTIARSQKTPSRMSQFADYVIPYPMSTTGSKRDSRSPHSFESSYPGQIRTFGHQSPIGQSFAMENFATVGRPGATSPASYQHRSGAFANAHLLPEMFEDDPRQSELSYDDSGKGGSVDDVGRFVLAQHAPSSVASSNIYPIHHHHPHRVSLRGHPGGPGHLTVGAEATLC